ncbi:hypothetical protein F0562_025711 [Nyssa sinensis]|uniref:Uncharacterized protein n=1 Tax=Nyssa sinensis TaxID=561372 RepID=A0A5J5B8J7_9ASTE|nr:hypothetical protein F0562_025711 [Nyssa sinensis]
MVRTPCCEKMGLKKGPWTPAEDQILISFIQQHGHENWRALPKQAGLLRCGKSCRLRWTNYLRPDIKRGNFSKEEEETIIKLHQILGNRWSAIATRLPGRTDNEIKNFWHTHLKKKLKLNLENPNSIGKSVRTLVWDIDNARESEPVNFSSQLRFRSLGYEMISAQKFFDNFPTSDPVMVTTSRPVKEEDVNNTTNVPEMNVKYQPKNSSMSNKCLGVVDPRLECSYSPEAAMERVDGNNSNINDEMVFWYNLFIKAGEFSQNS